MLLGGDVLEIWGPYRVAQAGPNPWARSILLPQPPKWLGLWVLPERQLWALSRQEGRGPGTDLRSRGRQNGRLYVGWSDLELWR